VPGSIGSFTWSGVWGTYFWVDPAEQLVAVQLIQVAPGKDGPINRTFRNLTYGALLVPGQGVPASVETKMTPRPGSFALLLPSWKGTPG
jgi:CubicO group peptidase (beta-lactamase class C family)